MNDVMKTGNKRALEEGDFVPLSKENTSQSATELLNKKWKEELTKSIGKKKRPKLWKSIVKMISPGETAVIGNGYRKNSSTNDSAEKLGFVPHSIPMDERCHENRQ